MKTAEWSSPVTVEDEGSNPSSATKPKYRRVAELIIRPLVVRKEKSAFDIAREFYAHHADLDFGDDLIEYMRNGYVITRPHLFCMVKPIRHDGDDAWFIRIIIGDLVEAITCLPCILPRIIFCRNNDPTHLVDCDTETLIKKAVAFSERKAA